jgi:bifunctional non-homologous end joining protein LigD
MTVHQLLERLPFEERDRLRPASHPAWTAPMLAKLTSKRFSDPDWLFERKLDGERALAFRDDGKVRLLSRNRKELNASYPELVDALAHEPCQDFVADGEIVAFEGHRTSFARLQGRMQTQDPKAARARGIAVFFYLFDLPYLAGYDLSALPLRRRKALMREAIAFKDPLRFTQHRDRDGEAFLREACEKGWEGLIAKRASAPYRHQRSSDWLKLKCTRGQELVIGGFTAPKDSREGFGALLLGYYEDGRLRYAGKVGTGFDHRFLVKMRRRLDDLARGRSPYAEQVGEATATFVEPELVAEIEFTEWTEAGRLRHPRFLGLRRDKAPRDVTRERPES